MNTIKPEVRLDVKQYDLKIALLEIDKQKKKQLFL